MEFEISPRQLRNIIREAAELGALIALTDTGKLKPYLKKREASRRFGEGKVNQWLAEGKLTVRKDGTSTAAWRIDRIEIEAIVKGMEIWRNLDTK
jgi:hypothetical protein